MTEPTLCVGGHDKGILSVLDGEGNNSTRRGPCIGKAGAWCPMGVKWSNYVCP